MTAPQTQRSVPEVLHDIIANVQAMIRAEFRLARTELSEKADAATRPAIGLGAAVVTAIYGCLFLLLSAVFALSLVVPLWAAALMVGVLLTIVGSILAISSANKLKSIRATPEKTVRNLKEDVWATRHTR